MCHQVAERLDGNKSFPMVEKKNSPVFEFPTSLNFSK